jgi:hypothetical protein
VDPKYDDNFKLSSDDTMDRLEKLADEPDRVWRLGLAYTMRAQEQRRKAEVKMILLRIARSEKRILGPTRIVEMVQKELEADKQIASLKTDMKRLWWMVGIIMVAIVGIVITKALK